MRPVKRNLHGLPNTEIVKSGTIRQTLLIEQWLIDSQGHGGTTFPAVPKSPSCTTKPQLNDIYQFESSPTYIVTGLL